MAYSGFYENAGYAERSESSRLVGLITLAARARCCAWHDECFQVLYLSKNAVSGELATASACLSGLASRAS